MLSAEIQLKLYFIDLKNLSPIKEDSAFYAIKNFIINNIKEPTFAEAISVEEKYTIIIAFTTMEGLHSSNTYRNLVKNGIRAIYTNQKDFDYCPCPMIVIGLEDLHGVLEEKVRKLSDQGKEYKVLENQLNVVKSLNLDPKANFFDSSIWHRYVALNENFQVNFKKTLLEIKENFKRKLYLTNVAKEFLEFQTRLLKNSYLVELRGGHANKVSPFQFHSATEMNLKATKIKDDAFKPSFKWHILLVDDYADIKLRIEGKEGKEGGPEKNEIIKKILSDKYDAVAVGDNWIEIETCESVKEFIDKLSDKNGHIHDIILLDYLLGEKTYGNKNGREYSTDILKWIKGHLKLIEEDSDYRDNENNASANTLIELNKSLQGPLGKFWFFPISVFSHAFLEDIHQMGYKHLEDEWYITRGADPVNTPELFRYSLFKFMEMQLNHACSFQNIKELIEKIFPISKINELISIQKLAKTNYSKFLKDMNAFEMLREDKERSNFAKSFIKANKDIDDAFWGHLHHLIFMLGHEPANEWEKMWDEFNIVEERLKKIENKTDTEKIDYLDPIRDYIIELQKQTRVL